MRARVVLEGAEGGLIQRRRRLGRDTLGALRLAEARLAASEQRSRRSADAALRQASVGVEGRAAPVGALDPARALARGWSITRDGAGRVVRDPATIGPGDPLTTTVAGGTITSTVDGRG